MPLLSTQIYRAIFERSPDAILLADDDARFVDANLAAEELTGYTREDLLRMRVFDLALEELRHDTDARWRDFLEAGEQTGPFELRRRDGTRRRLHYRATANVAPGLHVSMLRDVTREAELFAELQTSEQFLDAVFESSPISLQVFAADGRILRANRAWERLWGVSRAALAGYNVLEDSQLADKGVLDRVRAAFDGETVALPALRYDPAESHHPGRARWLSATFVPVLGPDGHPTQVVLALEDTTARRESDTRASIQYAVSRILAESSRIEDAAPLLVRVIAETLEWAYGALWLHDPAERVLRCSHVWTCGIPEVQVFAASMRTTFAPGEGLPGLVFQSREARWVPDFERDEPLSRLPSGPSAGFCSGVAIPVIVGDRPLGAVEFFSRAAEAPDDRLLDTLRGIGHQIGQYIERRAAEQAEADAALAANHVKDEFLAVLSHELRTPLNAILGWTRLLRGGQLDEGSRARALDIVERNVHAQTQIVEDLLDVSRIITGKLRLDLREVDFGRLVYEMKESMRPTADAKGVQVTCDAATDAIVKGDPSRLQQIVWNLLSNAFKFTPRGGHVTLRVARSGDCVEFSVADNGAGIEPALLPRVFDRFLQADSSTTRQHGGLGLGLAIVRHLTELQGGSVSVESEGIGRGATFRVRLPAQRSA